MMQERNVHNDTRAISNDYQMKVQFLRVLEQAALKIVSQMNHKWSTLSSAYMGIWYKVISLIGAKYCCPK